MLRCVSRKHTELTTDAFIDPACLLLGHAASSIYVSVHQLPDCKEPRAVRVSSEPPGNIQQRTAGEAKIDRVGKNESEVCDNQKRHRRDASVSDATEDGQLEEDLSPVESSHRPSTFIKLQEEVHDKRSAGMR